MTEPTQPTTETVADATQSATPSVSQPAASANQPASEPTEEFSKERAMNTIHNLREQEKEWKKSKSELEQLRAEKQQRADAELSEAQRLQKQVAELQAQNAKQQADIWRSKAAAEVDLPSILTDRIQGATLEEMQADAKKLAESLPKQSKAPTLNATNPGGAQQTETDAQKRERLFGKQGNPFDAEAIREKGGGVFWNK